MPSISYAITACNEHVELERLLNQLHKSIRKEDEIMLQLDSTNATQEVRSLAMKWSTKCYENDSEHIYEFHRIFAELNNDFALFKNNLMQHCTRDYIFFIDADEYLNEMIFHVLPQILELNPEVELYNIPRINTVEGLTQEHITKWRWRVNEEGYINYPDYQTRIIKNRVGIRWEGKVHERLINARITSILPSGLCLIHPKTIERQEKQNEFYETIN